MGQFLLSVHFSFGPRKKFLKHKLKIYKLIQKSQPFHMKMAAKFGAGFCSLYIFLLDLENGCEVWRRHLSQIIQTDDNDVSLCRSTKGLIIQTTENIVKSKLFSYHIKERSGNYRKLTIFHVFCDVIYDLLYGPHHIEDMIKISCSTQPNQAQPNWAD